MINLLCLSFGSLWWIRPGDQYGDSRKYSSRAAIFNTTGFCSGSRERRNWIVGGVIRLNAGTCIEQKMQLDQISPGKFMSPGLEQRGSLNRILLTRRIERDASVDTVLLKVNSAAYGAIQIDANWRSGCIRIVAASVFRGEQELLLLIPRDGEITTSWGTWRLKWNSTNPVQSHLTKE